MQIVLYRIDERLIHGQVMVAWQGKTGANTVVIVDEAAAKDEFMQQVYQLAAPANVKVECVGVEDFRKMVNDGDSRKAIILFKGPAEALAALKEGVPTGDLIVGNVSTAAGRSKYTKYAYMSEAEKDMLAELQSMGWKVNMQLLPDDTKIEFKK